MLSSDDRAAQTRARMPTVGRGPSRGREDVKTLCGHIAGALLLAVTMSACGSSPSGPSALPSLPPDLTAPAVTLPAGPYELTLSGLSFWFDPLLGCTPPGIASELGLRQVRIQLLLDRADGGWSGRAASADTVTLTLRDAGVTGTPPSRAVAGTLRGRATDVASGWEVSFDGVTPGAVAGSAVGALPGPASASSIFATVSGAARFVDPLGGAHDCNAVSMTLFRSQR